MRLESLTNTWGLRMIITLAMKLRAVWPICRRLSREAGHIARLEHGAPVNAGGRKKLPSKG